MITKGELAMKKYTKPIIIEQKTTISHGCGQGTCNGK